MARRDPSEFIDAFSALSRCLRSVAAEAYASFEVGSTQAKFLRHLGRSGPLSQAELARATVTDPTLTGRVLDTLVARGWVERSRSQRDRRQYVLELTPAGKRLQKRVEAARSRVAERVAAVLDERDRDDFERVAAKIIAAFADPADAVPRLKAPATSSS
ncbi:MAG TPA: MarR family transcriptional regulator [Polyangiaceae bacterium]|nr:MarR family transcriptional regulator [Polyangiaceae bacterium]